MFRNKSCSRYGRLTCIYVANEINVASASSVYFDDMLIRHIKAAMALQVTQVMDYYPFGLAINPLGYQKNGSFANKYLYIYSQNGWRRWGWGMRAFVFDKFQRPR